MAVPRAYLAAVAQAATKNNVPPELLAAQIQAESGWNPNAHNASGADGISQFMPGTAKAWGLTNTRDPIASIAAQGRMMGSLLKSYHGNVDMALAAYNAGPNAVAKYHGVPPYSETQNYIKSIKGYEHNYPGLAAGTINRAAAYGSLMNSSSKASQTAANKSLALDTTPTAPGGLDTSTMLMNYLVKASNPDRSSGDDSFDITQIVNAAQQAGATANETPTTSPAGTAPIGNAVGATGMVVPSGAEVNKAGYVNPFAKTTKLTPARIDQGVDYFVNKGDPLLAITDGVVAGIDHNWYKGQPMIWYKVTNGPMKGKFIFMAEGINPHVKPGDKFKAGDVIAHAADQGNGMEWGFAQSNGKVLTPYNGAPDGTSMPGGIAFGKFLKSLGAPVLGM